MSSQGYRYHKDLQEPRVTKQRCHHRQRRSQLCERGKEDRPRDSHIKRSTGQHRTQSASEALPGCYPGRKHSDIPLLLPPISCQHSPWARPNHKLDAKGFHGFSPYRSASQSREVNGQELNYQEMQVSGQGLNYQETQVSGQGLN